MSRPYFILSPCGTSLLTHGTDQELRAVINRHSNAKSEQEVLNSSTEEHKLIRDHLLSVEEKIAGADVASAQKYSAELNGILSLYGGVIEGRQVDFLQLLCTDTWLGEAAAKFVRQWLAGKGFVTDLRRQSDLRTVDVASFQVALSDLVQWCDEVVEGFRKSHRVVFNLTGGFKSIQGFLQTLAQFYADETVYIFETGKELLRLPRLPLQMAADDTVRQHLSAFRRLALGLKVEPVLVEDIPETLLMRSDDQVCLSPWGDLVWAQTKKTLYTSEVFSPDGVTELLAFGKDFNKSIAGLEANRNLIINEKIDDLILCLEEKKTGKGEPHNPASLDFKKLSGSPRPPSTHECDAWADQDAKRLYGHFDEREKFVLDCLGKHLK